MKQIFTVTQSVLLLKWIEYCAHKKTPDMKKNVLLIKHTKQPVLFFYLQYIRGIFCASKIVSANVRSLDEIYTRHLSHSCSNVSHYYEDARRRYKAHQIILHRA